MYIILLSVVMTHDDDPFYRMYHELEPLVKFPYNIISLPQPQVRLQKNIVVLTLLTLRKILF